MIFSIIFNLLTTFLVVYFFGSFLGKRGAPIFATYNLFVCFLLITYNFIKFIFFLDHSVIIFNFGNWMSALFINISWDFLIDSLSVLMLLVVIVVSFCVHMYSIYYMETDLNIIKFFSYITLFTFFMCILVLSSNFLVLFLGWEGVGLCSFLLISFWNTRLQANKAALKAMLINRVGDFFLLIGIVILVLNFKSVDFLTIFSLVHIYSLKYICIIYGYKISVIDAASFFILLGAVTKSAQLGLHGWLPDAMEGPTPVSALIHAATMVTAGVFLVIRTSFIFEFSLISLTILVYLGSLTACLFGIVGFFQYDIKKIIAFSTCSQLGYMMTACGLSGYNFAFFHLFTHAGFKALLFLSAGTFIHLTNNEQDLRKMSGVIKLSYLTCVVFIIGSLALMGFPFLSGFFSKEPIILLSFLYKSNPLIFFLIELSTCLTIMYSLKIFYYLFLKKNFNNRIFLAPTTFNLFNFLPLIILSIISLFSGYFFKTIFIGLGNNIFYGVIFTVNANVLEIEFISFFIKILPLLFLIVLNFIFYELYIIQFKQNPYLYFYNYNLFLFFNKRMFIDSLLNIFISFFFYRLSYKIFVLFDKGVLEICGPYLIVSNLFILNNIFISLLSKYFTKNVAAAVFLFFFLIFFIFFFNLFVFIL